MKALNILFNNNYPDNAGNQITFKEMLDTQSSHFEYVELKNFKQFEYLINYIDTDIEIYFWVHPNFGSVAKIVNNAATLEEIDIIPKFRELNIQIIGLSRMPKQCVGLGIAVIAPSDIILHQKNHTSYSVEELKKTLNHIPINPNDSKDSLRPIIQDSLKVTISNINNELISLKSFFTEKYTNDGQWYENIFPVDEKEIKLIFNQPYWQFSQTNYSTYFNIHEPNEPLLGENIVNVAEGISFDLVTLKWAIDISFFNQVSQRFEGIDVDYKIKLTTATRLYLIHETIHKVHNLDSDTVTGIGNFPKIVEEVDYQADAIAILTELAYFISTSENVNLKKAIIDKLSDIIKIAIETTFSFNPINNNLKLIQVRRVNRYLIWLFHYSKIQELRLRPISDDDLIVEILRQFSTKPMLEIAGPAIKSNKDRNRTFYDLNMIIHQEEVALLKPNNQIVRCGKTSALDFNDFYNGIKESNFNKLLIFMQTYLKLTKN